MLIKYLKLLHNIHGLTSLDQPQDSCLIVCVTSRKAFHRRFLLENNEQYPRSCCSPAYSKIELKITAATNADFVGESLELESAAYKHSNMSHEKLRNSNTDDDINNGNSLKLQQRQEHQQQQQQLPLSSQ
ncbi:Hypothetical predicted protein [Octopus vulgaris]|uniref:Uncharacterized protein n=1 Tax=Octopus vulgaris TaxID=6645 RepID=A0AA36ARA7_OCTVU|nr:Hypothetical predicted protein [Octopus vulgaris]